MKVLIASLLFYILFVGTAIAADGPNDVGDGLSYEAITVAVLRWNNPAPGEAGAIVTQSQWANGSYVAPGTGKTIFLVHWPRNADDSAKALDVSGIVAIENRGISIFGYWMPEISKDDGQELQAEVEISVLALQPSIWPGQGWGSTKFQMALQ